VLRPSTQAGIFRVARILATAEEPEGDVDWNQPQSCDVEQVALGFIQEKVRERLALYYNSMEVTRYQNIFVKIFLA
jgi:hypothetical protein